MDEVIGTYDVPSYLIGAKRKDVEDWARNILRGQEAKLDRKTKDGILGGNISQVFLEPIAPGTYLPNGEFIEAMEYSPAIGDDFSKAEEVWAIEERFRDWIHEENERFNKNSTRQSNNNPIDYWEHGRRIVQLSEEINKPTSHICRELGKSMVEGNYRWLSHSLHVDFYNWKPNLDENDQVFLLVWKSISDILMFGRSSIKMKDYILCDLVSAPFNQLNSQEIYMFLNGNLTKHGFSDDESIIIENGRQKYRQLVAIKIGEKQELLNLLKRQ